jgi:hypothetical protein
MTKLLLTHGTPILANTMEWGGRKVKIVAILGQADDWAAYVGEMNHSVNEIASNGLKVNKEQVKDLFPVLNIANYRR